MFKANGKAILNLFILVVLLLLIASVRSVSAQSGPTFTISMDYMPYQGFKDKLLDSVVVATGDSVYFDDPLVQLNKIRGSFTYPLVFAEGRTVLVNDFTYQLIEFKYRDFRHALSRLQSAAYTLMLQRRLSQKWSGWILGTISLASDLKAEVSGDDFNAQTAIIFIRHFSERFSLGAGAAYSTQFGDAALIPILAFDWNNGSNLLAKAIIPVSFEFWYRPCKKADIGLLISGDGNNFRGDPRIYEVLNPELRYTMMTVGPAAKIYLNKWATLNIEGGIIGLHRFEFFDGNTEHGSYDLDPDYYIRTGFTFGGR